MLRGIGRKVSVPAWFWPAFAIASLLVLQFAGRPTATGIAPVVLAFAMIGLAIGHAVLALGSRAAGVFLTICLTVTYATENLSVLTGLPFGHYHFVVGAGLPHVGAIPLIVGFLYFGMGYPSWVVAGILLDRAGLYPDTRASLFALPVIASFVMVQWDVVMDPPNSTLGGVWLWHDGGGYFGVPLTNFVGWYMTVWLFFQIFAGWAYSRRRETVTAVDPASSFWLIPILMYLDAGLCQVAPFFGAEPFDVVDASGRHWRAHDIRETALIVMVATMLATSALALFRWSAPNPTSHRR